MLEREREKDSARERERERECLIHVCISPLSGEFILSDPFYQFVSLLTKFIYKLLQVSIVFVGEIINSPEPRFFLLHYELRVVTLRRRVNVKWK